MQYDVVMYFYWAPAQIVHKYLSLHNKLRDSCKVLTIIGRDEFGITAQQFSHFSDEYLEDVKLATVSEALRLLSENDYKLAVFSSNGRKGFVNPDGTEPPALGAKFPNVGKDIAIARSKGAKTLQISEMITDFYYAGAEIVSLVSPAMKDIHLNPSKFKTYHTYQWRPFDARPEPEYIYSNCLLWERNGDCLPYMSKSDFCAKYGLDANKQIYVYLPSKAQHVMHGVAKDVYKKVCSMENVVVKYHPTEYTRLAANRIDNKWSKDLCGVPDVPALDPLDTHWCYEYADCAITNQSSVSIELPLYDTPFLYVQPTNFALSNFFLRFGHSCGLDEIEDFLSNKKYLNKIENLDEFYDTIMFNTKQKSSDILCAQIKGLIK